MASFVFTSGLIIPVSVLLCGSCFKSTFVLFGGFVREHVLVQKILGIRIPACTVNGKRSFRH
jgi:hypothetical protein